MRLGELMEVLAIRCSPSLYDAHRQAGVTMVSPVLKLLILVLQSLYPLRMPVLLPSTDSAGLVLSMIPKLIPLQSCHCYSSVGVIDELELC